MAVTPSETDTLSASGADAELQDIQTCQLEVLGRPSVNAEYVEHAHLCLVVAPYGYEFSDGLESIFLARVNAEREAIGLPQLLYRPELLAAARYHSLDMAANDFFGHSGPDGRRPHGRIEAFDRTLLFDSSRENLATVSGIMDTSQIAELLHTGLMNSPGHRENILADNITHVAMGVVRSSEGVWLTQVFARQVGVLSSPAPLRMSPGEPLEVGVELTGWSFRRFAADDGKDLVPFEQRRRNRPPLIPDGINGDIILRARGEKPGNAPNTLTYIYLSGPLVTVE